MRLLRLSAEAELPDDVAQAFLAAIAEIRAKGDEYNFTANVAVGGGYTYLIRAPIDVRDVRQIGDTQSDGRDGPPEPPADPPTASP